MSLNAFIWASGLPMDLVGHSAYRVLLKYADRADPKGKTAWATSSTLAEELGCSTRTIQRAVRELVVAGLLVEGDQRHVAHLRGDRKPVVYDLNLTNETPPQLSLDDTTSSVVPHDTTNMSRGDRSGLHDTTSGVAYRTVLEQSNSNNVTTEQVSPREVWSTLECPGDWKTKTHQLGQFGKCIHCHEKPASWIEGAA